MSLYNFGIIQSKVRARVCPGRRVSTAIDIRKLLLRINKFLALPSNEEEKVGEEAEGRQSSKGNIGISVMEITLSVRVLTLIFSWLNCKTSSKLSEKNYREHEESENWKRAAL